MSNPAAPLVHVDQGKECHSPIIIGIRIKLKVCQCNCKLQDNPIVRMWGPQSVVVSTASPSKESKRSPDRGGRGRKRGKDIILINERESGGRNAAASAALALQKSPARWPAHARRRAARVNGRKDRELICAAAMKRKGQANCATHRATYEPDEINLHCNSTMRCRRSCKVKGNCSMHNLLCSSIRWKMVKMD